MSDTEADTCRKFVVPRLQGAAWENEPHPFAERRTIIYGRIIPVGKGFVRNPPKRLDYILRYTQDFAIPAVEAKAAYKNVEDGFQQAKIYAEMWVDPEKRAGIIQRLAEWGISFDEPAETARWPDADPFDLLCHLVFNGLMRSTRERARQLRNLRKDFFAKYSPDARQILDKLLEKDADHGAAQSLLPNVLKVPPVSEQGQFRDIIKFFGGADQPREAVTRLQTLLYAD